MGFASPPAGTSPGRRGAPGAASYPSGVNAQRVASVVGLVVVALTAVSVARTLLVPKGNIDPVMRVVDRVVDTGYRWATRAVKSYPRRDAILSSQAAALLMTLLVTWLGLFLLGFTLLLLPTTPSFGNAVRETGSSLLTLGFASTARARATVVDIAAAFTGLVTVALQIGFLPTLYAAYNRRETEVTLLGVRAGEPAWGPELLARTHVGLLGIDLASFYATWERWAADVAESHSTYPMLLRFRSPQPYSSWLVSLIAVLDAAAMETAVNPATAPPQARLCLRMGFKCLQGLARTAGTPVDEDPMPDAPITLTIEEFRAGYERLILAGFPVQRSVEEAWPHFRGWRVNYEAAALGLAKGIDAVPALWTGPRRGDDTPIPPRRPANRTPEHPTGAPGKTVKDPEPRRGR